MTTTYDTKCHDLAEAFLADTELDADDKARHASKLAGAIQQTIEDFFEYEIDE